MGDYEMLWVIKFINSVVSLKKIYFVKIVCFLNYNLVPRKCSRNYPF